MVDTADWPADELLVRDAERLPEWKRRRSIRHVGSRRVGRDQRM